MRVILSTLPREGAYKSWITPSSLEPHSIKYIPLGLLSLATNARSLGHEIIIIDPFSNEWTIEQTKKEIMSRNPDVVGFTASTRWSYALYRMLKEIDVRWKIVGGAHAMYHAQEIIEWGADKVFVGQIADLEFKAWLTRPHKGITYCSTELKEIFFPDRSLIDYKDYFYSGKVLFEAKKRMSMFTSVGCPNACRFCSVQNRDVQTNSPEKVMAEMWCLNALGAESVHIFDDNFNVNSKRVSLILDEMEKTRWDVEWSMRGQVKFDLSLVPRMKKLGLKRIHVGIESFDNMALKWLGKNHTYADIEAFCKVMNENNIDMLAYFIIGTPFDDIRNMVEKIKNLGIKTPYINILFPEPDTRLYYDMIKEKGRPDFWKEYFRNPVPDFEVPMKDEYAIEMAEEMQKEFLR